MEISLDRWIPDDDTHTRAARQCTDGNSGMVHFPDNKICRCKIYANRYHTQTRSQSGIQSQTFVRILFRSRSLAHSQRTYAFYAEKHIILMLMFIRIYFSHLRHYLTPSLDRCSWVRASRRRFFIFHFGICSTFFTSRGDGVSACARISFSLLPTLCVSEIVRYFGKYALHERTSNVIYSVNGKHSVAHADYICICLAFHS